MGDNWITPTQDNERLKQVAKMFFKTTWEPIHITKDEEMTYFNNKRRVVFQNQYDLYFAFSKPGPLYDQRKLKENRQFQQDIRDNIFYQEQQKAVPAVTSLNYGKRKQIEHTEVQYNRVGQIPSFYRRNGAFPVDEKAVSSGIHAVPALQ